MDRQRKSKAMKKGDFIAVNFGKSVEFDTLLLDQGQSGGDYPKRFDVFVSDNGRDWRSPLICGEGTEGITIVRFPKEQKKRYVRIVCSEAREQANIWWSVSELYAMSAKSDELAVPLFPKVLERRR